MIFMEKFFFNNNFITLITDATYSIFLPLKGCVVKD